MLDLEELRFHQSEGVWRYCLSKTKEFGDKIAVEKWKYLMFASIFRDVLSSYPSGQREDIVVRAVLDRIPSEIQGDLGDAEKALRITQLDLEFRDLIIRRGRKGQPPTLRLKKEPFPDAPLHLAGLHRNMVQSYGTCEFDVACSCGNTSFTVEYLATCLDDEPDSSIQFSDLYVGNGHLFRFEIKCELCDERYELFDKWVHGWDGFHRRLKLGDKSQHGYPSPATEMKGEFGPPIGELPECQIFSCPACHCLPHEVHIAIGVDDEYDDFKSHHRDNRALFKGVKMKDAWSSTFGSIAIGLKCSGCGAERAEIFYESA